MKRFRTRLALLATLATMALGLGLVQAEAATVPSAVSVPQIVERGPATARYISNCNGHDVQMEYTTAGGNLYQMTGHVCLEINDYSADRLAVNARWHGHCTRNGAVWSGCRVNTTAVVQLLTSSGWQTQGSTANDVAAPSSGYFGNTSATYVSFAKTFCYGSTVRGAVVDPDNMRFLLADGTTVLRDLRNSYSAQGEIIPDDHTC